MVTQACSKAAAGMLLDLTVSFEVASFPSNGLASKYSKRPTPEAPILRETNQKYATCLKGI